MTPFPVPPGLFARLVDQAGGSEAVSAMLHVDARNVRRWASGQADAPWAAVELLRRLLMEPPAKG